MWPALAIYGLKSLIGEGRDLDSHSILLIAVVLPLAAMYNAGGVAFAIGYSLHAAGPAAFDAARRLTFSNKRYPVLDKMRPLHRETVERRMFEAREFAFAQVQGIIDDPLSSHESFWRYVFTATWLMLQFRLPIYRPNIE